MSSFISIGYLYELHSTQLITFTFLMPSLPGTLIAKSSKVKSTMKETYCDGGFASIFPILQQQRLHHLLLGHDLQRKDEHEVGLENLAVKSSVQGHCDANIQHQRHSQRKDFNTVCVSWKKHHSYLPTWPRVHSTPPRKSSSRVPMLWVPWMS